MLGDPHTGLFLSEAFARAVSYPHVTPADFDPARGSFALDLAHDSRGVARLDIQPVQPESLEISPAGELWPEGAVAGLPAWDLAVTRADGTRLAHERRVAMVGIGSNSSRLVLRDMFERRGQDARFVVMQAELPDHVVVHGAVIGRRGTVGAALARQPGARAAVTVGFFAEPEIPPMRIKEAHYDGRLLASPARLAGGGMRGGTRLDQPLVWDLIPGLLSRDGARPLALTAIPASGHELERLASPAAIELIRSLTAPDLDFWPFIDRAISSDDWCARVTERLAAGGHAIAAGLEGARALPALTGHPRADITA